MRVECVKEKIQNAVLSAERMTGKNLSLPILSNILLIAENGELCIRATNLELGMEVRIPAKVEQEGVVALSGAILGGLLASLGNEKSVVLEMEGQNLVISTKNNTSRIKTHPAEDFPTIPKVDAGETFQISSQVFVDGVKGVGYSASVSTVKPEIASVYVYPDDDKIVFVATDSFRLAEKSITLKKTSLSSSALIPYRNLLEVVRVIESCENDVNVSMNKNQISFSVDGVYVTSRVVDGVFPDYRQIIPKEFTTEAVLLKQDIVNALRITNLFSDKFRKVVFTVSPEKKLFQVGAQNADVGENTTRVDAALTGSDIAVGFNHKYILDCFQSIHDDSVSFQFSGEGRPLVIRGVKEKGFLYLVMPMNR